MFNPHATSAPLLLSMLAIAACLERNPVAGGKDGLDADKLFAMAETALHHCRNESRLDVLQALMILSLRQTGCGDKRSAFSYAGRASCMALNLGLHMASTATLDAGETEQRARVYWVSHRPHPKLMYRTHMSWTRFLQRRRVDPASSLTVARPPHCLPSQKQTSLKPGPLRLPAAPLCRGGFGISFHAEATS